MSGWSIASTGGLFLFAIFLVGRSLLLLSRRTNKLAERIAWLEAKINGMGGHEDGR